MGGILQWEKEGSRSIFQDKNAYFAAGDTNSKDWKLNQFDKTTVDVETSSQLPTSMLNRGHCIEQ